MRTACVFLLLWLLSSQPVAAAIYRCVSDGEPILYSQFVCPPQNRQERYQPTPHSLVSIPPLSGEEVSALARLEKSLQRTRASARKIKARARSQQARRASQARQLCTEANDQLATLRDRKRQGYSAADGRKLDVETERLQIQKKANC